MLSMLSLSVNLIYTFNLSIHLICYNFHKTTILLEGFGTHRMKFFSVFASGLRFRSFLSPENKNHDTVAFSPCAMVGIFWKEL